MKNTKILHNAPFVIQHLMRDPAFARLPWILIRGGGQNDKGGIRNAECGIQNRIRNLKCEMRNDQGFTLIELIVSVAITAILMVGISIFFSSTFRNMFQAQTQATNTQSQFTMNEILRSKFATLEDVITPIENSSEYIITRNKNTKGQMPFTYIGSKDERLVFKDFIPFNKMNLLAQQHLYADSGSGQIKNAENGNSINAQLTPAEIKNFSSFVKVNKTYYVVMPHENKVIEANCNGTCTYTPLTFEKKNQLKSPTDVVVDKDQKYIYISDSENGRIIKHSITGPNAGTSKIIISSLKYPTGLAYYYDKTTEWLFVAETLGNKVIKINLADGKYTTVAGDGDDTDCGSSSATYKHTAKFCKLNMPTGLNVYEDATAKTPVHELYIADSGNNRILKIKDPPVPDKLTFKIDVGKNYALDKIVIENGNLTGGSYAEAITPSSTPYIMPIGSAKHYNSSTKTFSNTETLTTFVNATCKSESSVFYVNGDINNMDIGVGDTLIVGDKEKIILTVAAWDTKDCKISPSTSSLPTGKITVEGDASQITNGLTVYPANPKQMAIQINSPKIEIKPNFSGFQKFTIKIYDFFDGLAYTAYQTERIGDGKIGTPEDTIEVVAKNETNETKIKFPTGVTNTYFANSGAMDVNNKSKILKISDKTDTSDITVIDPKSYKSFDYTSDFTLADTNGIQFNQPNNKKILEMIINAKTDETDATKTRTYKLNATLSK